jgi:hypothetical protein
VLTRRILGWLEWVANPALAGLAFLTLSLGVITWLPALAAAGVALRKWREEGDQRCFVATFQAFGQCWTKLWKHSILSTMAIVMLLTNIVTLDGIWRAPQIGILLALIPYHLGLAILHRPREALVFAFGSLPRGLLLLGAAVLAPLIALPLAIGPFLFGPTLPLLVALHLHQRNSAQHNSAQRNWAPQH